MVNKDYHFIQKFVFGEEPGSNWYFKIYGRRDVKKEVSDQ